MKYLLRKILFLTLLIHIGLHGQPNSKDYLRLAVELGVFSYSQFFYNPEKNFPNSSTINSFDSSIRNVLRWETSSHKRANKLSDLLLYGVFVGSMPISSYWLNNFNLLLINLEILSINGLITNIVKYGIGRQRPYSFYQTKIDDDESYKSFFSGHTSTAFALGTSTAKMLCNYTSFNTKAIWASTLSLATATGYLRIAADKHYFTDVLVGAIIGSTVGHIAFEKLHRRYNKKISNSPYLPRFSYSPFNIYLIVPL